MDYFDMAEEHGGKLAEVFRGSPTRFCIIAFTSDWLFPPAENKIVAHALNAVAGNVSFVVIDSDKGHDAFLLDEPEMFAAVDGFVDAVAQEAGIA
jgi:homoserine O-acetyltransferase